MSRRAILRWPHGSEWGHLAEVPDGGGLPRFTGFVRMTDPRVQTLITLVEPQPADEGMWEVHFTAAESELVPT
ncbi:hypothetical protein SAMN02982929_04404 [Saccharopolyspora kobensis]|uniref:Uncharacterized protein n=1 Tax=Saccharopolyspora kobensis TaxID=146035 RepID=A0A1H6DI89_9PSEU|nr:hypothetical protein [Saccharopolyspora kobensis]SEG84296.1 hypothetical protein SAMN02982929_04404 [Saccharopolyspora kobensis]SFD28872.1 hypothetical protein SAMN05216506_103387 [Saccharopolyspora kobensis]